MLRHRLTLRRRSYHIIAAGLVSEFQTGNSSIDTKSMGRLEKGIARTQTPTNKNYALELLTFETIVGVSSPGVQWTGITRGEPPS